MSLLHQLLDAPVETAQADSPHAADDRPARKRRLDRSDRWRLISGAIALWALGLVCTGATFSLLTGPLIGAGLALVAQWVLSNGQLLLLTGVGLVAKVAGVALLGIDGTLNAVGGDVLIPGATITIDLRSAGFWLALAIGLVIAGLPELMWRTAHRK
jgi:hypothetical protein